MNYINEKYAIIKNLVKHKKEKEDALTLAIAENEAANVALTTKQVICANDLTDLTNVKASYVDTRTAYEKLEQLYEDIKKSCVSSEKLHSKVLEMVEDAHHTARKTIVCAVKFEELGKHVHSAEKGGPDKAVLLSLISSEVAKAPAVAEKAVTAANTALKDAIAAAGTVIHLHNSLLKTKELIEKALPLFKAKDKKTGLSEILDELKKQTHEIYEEALHDQHEAESEFKKTQKYLAACTNDLDVVTQGLDAAEKAIALAAAN